MTDLWSIGPTAAAFALRTQGFSSQEADRIVALRRRYERGEFAHVSTAQKRLVFARWLVEHGRLTDHVDTAETAAYGPACVLPGMYPTDRFPAGRHDGYRQTGEPRDALEGNAA